ncbi:oligosaccharide flippase family protein [Aquincola sp. MAHUQ-54]|uniref:Oligosaccharide flippase family protein n=1 Tax=Aquincola agrisoli TaxID=3119538 RepID=A0AAW9QK33_9BURK
MRLDLIYTTLAVGSRLAASLFLFLLLARLWGPEVFGNYSFLFSCSALLVLIVDFGFPLYLVREVSLRRNNAPEIVARAFQAKTILCLLLVALVAVSALLLHDSMAFVWLALSLLSAAIANSYAEFFLAPLRSLGRFDLEAKLVLSANALYLVTCCGAAWFIGSPESVAIASFLSRLIFALTAYFALTRLTPIVVVSGNWASWPKTLKKTWPYGVDGFLVSAWSQLDIVIVQALFGPQSTGLYAAGQKVVLGVIALAPIVGNIAVPRLSGLSNVAGSAFWAEAKSTALKLMCIGTVFAAPMVLAPQLVTQLLYGRSFLQLAEFLPWFGAIVLIRYSGAVAGVIATSLGKQKHRVFSQVVGLCVALFGCLWLSSGSYSLMHFLFIWCISLSVVSAGNFVAVRCAARVSGPN